MKKLIMLFICGVLLVSCGQSINTEVEEVVTPVVEENPSDESGEMIDGSSTLILEKNTNSIESGVKGGVNGEELSL